MQWVHANTCRRGHHPVTFFIILIGTILLLTAVSCIRVSSSVQPPLLPQRLVARYSVIFEGVGHCVTIWWLDLAQNRSRYQDNYEPNVFLNRIWDSAYIFANSTSNASSHAALAYFTNDSACVSCTIINPFPTRGIPLHADWLGESCSYNGTTKWKQSMVYIWQCPEVMLGMPTRIFTDAKSGAWVYFYIPAFGPPFNLPAQDADLFSWEVLSQPFSEEVFHPSPAWNCTPSARPNKLSDFAIIHKASSK
jgi:hypothetical protein